MKKKAHTTSLVLLLVIIFAFWWGISVLSQYSGSSVGKQQPTDTPVVLVHHTNVDGLNTYTGNYILNSPCDLLGSGIQYSGKDSGHVAIVLTFSPSPGTCSRPASTTSAPFLVSVKLKNTSPVPTFDGVMFNGTSIPVQLVEGN